MAESALMVQVVPVETETDRQLFGMAIAVLNRLIWEIILEGREHERMGNCEIDLDRVDRPGPGDLGRAGFSR
jgi:hypothetical protein